MRSKLTLVSATWLLLMVVQSPSASFADIFTVTDANFDNGVYEFRYYSKTNKAFVNGSEISYSSLFLTNDGVTGPVNEGVVYYEATGHHNAIQLAGSITMGWDLSAVTLELANVEILSDSAIFQFDPWAAHAFEDKIFGEVATPNSFGTGTYHRYFEYEGDNNGSVGAKGNSGQLQDVTSHLDSNWLDNPNLFELLLGYQQHPIDSTHPNIPGKHIQFFRDDSGTGNDSFLLRISTVPEPSSSLIAAGLLGWIVLRRRKRVAI